MAAGAGAASRHHPVEALAAALLAVTLASGAARGEELPTADTSRVFASWGDWEAAHGGFVAALDAFDEISAKPIDSAGRLLAVLEARDRAYRTGRRVEGYIYLRLQLDGTDEEARSRQHLLDESDKRWHTQGQPWLTAALKSIGRQTVEEWVADEEALADYAFFLTGSSTPSSAPSPRVGRTCEPSPQSSGGSRAASTTPWPSPKRRPST